MNEELKKWSQYIDFRASVLLGERQEVFDKSSIAKKYGIEGVSPRDLDDLDDVICSVINCIDEQA